MLTYYLKLALRSFRRNTILTALMVLSIGAGIGATMTTLTVLRLLSGDPLPGRSQHIFYPQVDAFLDGEPHRNPYDKLDYRSTVDLWQARRADRQAPIVDSGIKVLAPSAGTPALMTTMLATSADFFPMFDVLFTYGSGWSDQDDARRARLAVISADLNQKLFGGENSVGRRIRLRNSELRIVGVLAPWRPSPQFYTLAGGSFAQGDTANFYAKPEDVMVPFFTGLEINDGNFLPWTCWSDPPQAGHLQTMPCVGLQLWVQLDSPAKQADYRRFLADYTAQQKALGRIADPHNTRLPSLMDWMAHNRVVPGDVRLQSWLAVAFLVICLFNTVGLLLAKFLRRGGEIGVRRALGASRRAIFVQYLIEAGLVGLAGGVLGGLLTQIGLWTVRQQPVEYADLAYLDLPMFVLTFVLALLVSVAAGLFPASRASHVPPALQLKNV